jgi:DNA replication and repair protein RecF
MHIRKLRLFDFKNYHETDVVFSPDINCISGFNGSGKTNLIDAIHYLALTRSAFNSIEKENIRHGTDAFMIQSEWEDDGQLHSIICSYQSGKPKSVRFDGKEYDRVSDHIGRIPLVLITPYDTDLIRGGSEGRRKFFDSILCQADQLYLQELMVYNRALRHRNEYIKGLGGRRPDKDLLETLTRPLIIHGTRISDKRSEFLEVFRKDFMEYYEIISSESEEVEIQYKSHASGDLEKQYTSSLTKDLALERTTVGIHRDEFGFFMNDKPVKKFASQGQQKSFILAMKLAQFTYLFRSRGKQPVILLDDIFDKLDMKRIKSLMSLLTERRGGQVFITDARAERVRDLFSDSTLEVKNYTVENGNIHEIE